MSLIKVDGLTKIYKLRTKKKKRKSLFSFARKTRKIHAVDDMNFSIDKGEIVGYIGKNGAGKSTTIKMLSGILVPTAGEVQVAGIVPHKKRVQNAQRIGVVFGQKTQLYWDLPVRDTFTFLRKLYRINRKQYQENMDYFNHFFDLGQLLDQPVRKLSLGQRMKCDICASLLHNPEIMYLDEPTIGLDIITKRQVREFIKKINQERGTTIILTTHDLTDIELLCSRIILIDKGKKMYDGPIDGIQSHLTSKRLVKVITREPFKRELVGVEQFQQENENQINFVIDLDQIAITKIIEKIEASNIISDITVHELDLEQLVYDYYQEKNKVGVG